MSRRGESLTLSLPPGAKERLEELAIELGCTWGDRPNISKLIEAIAFGQVALHKSGSPINPGDKEQYVRELARLKATLKRLEAMQPDHNIK